MTVNMPYFSIWDTFKKASLSANVRSCWQRLFTLVYADRGLRFRWLLGFHQEWHVKHARDSRPTKVSSEITQIQPNVCKALFSRNGKLTVCEGCTGNSHVGHKLSLLVLNCKNPRLSRWIHPLKFSGLVRVLHSVQLCNYRPVVQI